MRMYQSYSNIQNGYSWCWVVAAKLVGQHYMDSANFVIDQVEPSKQSYPTNLFHGFRPDYVGFDGTHWLIDATQMEIVTHVYDTDQTGFAAASDQVKRDALRYVVTGTILSSEIEVRTYGVYTEKSPLSWNEDMEFIFEQKRAFIGNMCFIHRTRRPHSIVCIPISSQEIIIYDPWDGYRTTLTLKQLVETGFLTNHGAGIVSWLQYIR